MFMGSPSGLGRRRFRQYDFEHAVFVGGVGVFDLDFCGQLDFFAVLVVRCVNRDFQRIFGAVEFYVGFLDAWQLDDHADFALRFNDVHKWLALLFNLRVVL